MACKFLVTYAVEVLEHPGKHIAREPDIANFVLRIQDRLGDQVGFGRKNVNPICGRRPTSTLKSCALRAAIAIGWG